MGARIQTLDWLNVELDSKESELAAARQRIAEQDDEISACKERPGGCWYWREAARLRAKEKSELETLLAEARRKLEEAKDEIAHHCLWIETFGKELIETKQQLAASQERERMMLAAIQWALGEAGSDFGDKKPANALRYWWRSELRERAGLKFDSDDCKSFPVSPIAIRALPEEKAE